MASAIYRSSDSSRVTQLLAERVLEVVVEVWRWKSALDGRGGGSSKRNTSGVVLIYVCGIRAVFLKHGGGALGIVKSPVCNYNHRKTKINHGPLPASHSLMDFSFLSERKCRPRSQAPCMYILFFWYWYRCTCIYLILSKPQ